ncbi:hypothetical protein OA501_02565 [Flavobacteriaceae bacterium]|nr:hypothetical protein [Flavobacteriaceae bacterium]
MPFNPTVNSNVTLHSSETMVLKSIALGLSDHMIQKLFEINNDELDKLRSSLYTKLNVNNSYAAVRVAYQKNLLKEKDYCTEKIRALALRTASDKVNVLSGALGDSKEVLWELYDVLLEFHTRVESTYKANNVFLTK